VQWNIILKQVSKKWKTALQLKEKSKMKKTFIVAVLMIASNLLFSQNVSVIKITDLEKRLSKASDTTYIVNFWATWCAPCVKELPDFDSISKQFPAGNVKVLLVCMDFKEDLESKVLPFVKKKKLQSEVVLLDEVNGNYFIPKVSDSWTGSIPATLIQNNKRRYKQFYEKKLDYSSLITELEKQK
jgi:thiol-disulfide isomerase/thioredoxin